MLSFGTVLPTALSFARDGHPPATRRDDCPVHPETEIRPFEIAIPDADLDDLRDAWSRRAGRPRSPATAGSAASP
jgi:hypothetical protein